MIWLFLIKVDTSLIKWLFNSVFHYSKRSFFSLFVQLSYIFLVMKDKRETHGSKHNQKNFNYIIMEPIINFSFSEGTMLTLLFFFSPKGSTWEYTFTTLLSIIIIRQGETWVANRKNPRRSVMSCEIWVFFDDYVNLRFIAMSCEIRVL